MAASSSISSRVIARFEGRRRYAMMAAEGMLLAGVAWFVGPRLLASRLAAPIGTALLLVLFFWIGAFAVELTVFLAVSWDDFRDVLLESLRASAPAMWFAPAILFLSLPSGICFALGLLLVANTTRLLFSRNAPRKLNPRASPGRTQGYRMFGDSAAPDVPFSRQVVSPVLGALAIQSGVCGFFAGLPLPAAVLTGCGTAIWTWTSIARGAARRVEGVRSSHWLIGIVLTLLIASSLSVAQLQEAAAPTDDQQNVVDNLKRVWAQLERPSPSKPRISEKNVAKLVTPDAPRDPLAKRSTKKEIGGSGTYYAPGVILRADGKSQRQFALVFPIARARNPHPTVESTLSIPFSGEYRLFPTSSAKLQHEWVQESGTLLENSYATAGAGSLETEAYQKLDPPVDVANCGKVRLVLVSGEDGPFGASVELEASGSSLSLGTEVCGLDRYKDETVEFAVPNGPHNLQIKGIRVGFHRIPRQGRQSMRVSVKQFVMEPRGR